MIRALIVVAVLALLIVIAAPTLLSVPVAPALVSELSATPAEWIVDVWRDEMTGAGQAGATSPVAKPTRTPEWPYHDMEAQLTFVCDSDGFESAFVSFNKSNFLHWDGYVKDDEIFYLRAKWDDRIHETGFSSPRSNDDVLHFTRAARDIQNIANHTTLLLEVEQRGSGKLYFRFSLTGSAAAIAKARAACK